MKSIRWLTIPAAFVLVLALVPAAFAAGPGPGGPGGPPPGPPGGPPPGPPGPGKRFVGHTTVGNNSSCAQPGYTSVQAAVDAAGNNKTVYLCGGQFAEQVFLNKSITLTGDPGSGLTAVGATFTTSAARYPTAFATDNLFIPQVLLVVTGNGTKADINGLIISGPLPGNGTCAEDEYGVIVIGGANATMTGDSVLNIGDSVPSLDGCQFGVGIQIGREYWPTADFSTYDVENFVGQATIDGTTVSGYAKNGIDVDAPGSNGTIQNSTVTGAGPTIVAAQNGIQIGRGAKGDVHNNTISANQYTGSGQTEATGVLIFGGCGDPLTPGITVHDNTISNNDVGIYLDNEIDACGAASTKKSNEDIHNNKLSNSAVTNTTGDGTRGYQAGITDIGNGDNIHDNTISGAGYAARDDATALVIPIDTSAAINPKLHNNKSM